MQFQGRGTTYLSERVSDTQLGKPIPICQDEFSVSLTTENFEHINKCGAVDVPDYRGTKSVSGEITLTFTDVANKKLAIAMLGTVTAAAGGTSSVTNETTSEDIEADDVWFVGQLEQHRALTAVVITDSASSPATLALNTNYTVDAATGKITFVNVAGFTQPFQIDYTHQDPASVSFLSAAQKEYFARFEGINKANSNAKGSVELYRVRFDPAQNADFLSDELQIMSLKGTVLADSTKDVDDTEYGQFGRRVGF